MGLGYAPDYTYAHASQTKNMHDDMNMGTPKAQALEAQICVCVHVRLGTILQHEEDSMKLWA